MVVDWVAGIHRHRATRMISIQTSAGVLLKRFVKELSSESTSESVKTEELENIIDSGLEKFEYFEGIWLCG